MSDSAVIPAVDPETGLTPETQALVDLAREGLTVRDPMTPVMTPPPEGVPVKFWDPVAGSLRTDDLLKSYAELEKTVGQPKVVDPAAIVDPAAVVVDPAAVVVDPAAMAEPELDADGNPIVVDEAAAAPVLETHVAAARDAYAETGEVSEELRAPFLAAGISSEQIDLYLAGVKATENALVAAVVEPFGGREAYDEAVAWAATNWTEKQILAFNSQTGDPATAKTAAAGLKASFMEANPGEGTFVNVNTHVAGGDTYGHMDEFQKDLAESETLRDPIKRRHAIEKLDRSRKSGRIKSGTTVRG